MADLNVFDPALCCSTGACGAEVDASLVRFAADVDWQKGPGRRASSGAHVSIFRKPRGMKPLAFAHQNTPSPQR